MKKAFSVLTVILGVAATATTANAQVFETEDPCEYFVITNGQSDGRGTIVNSCVAAQQNRFNAIYVSSVVQRMVARSFGFGPRTVQPAGLQGMISAEEHLSPSEIAIVPTADAAPAAPSPMWNAWIDGRYLYTDDTVGTSDLDGATVTALGGFDYKLTTRMTFGVLGTYERTDRQGLGVEFDSSTWGGGAYLGYVLTDNLVFSANLMGSRLDSDIDNVINFEATRLQGSAAVNGYWYRDTWRFNPSISLALSRDWEEETNGLFPDRTITSGVLTPAVQFGNTLRLSDTTTVEPWAGAALDWTFLSEVDTDGLGTDSETDLDLRVQAGLNFGFGSNAQLAITGEAAGLIDDDTNSYSIEANLAVQF